MASARPRFGVSVSPESVVRLMFFPPVCRLTGVSPSMEAFDGILSGPLSDYLSNSRAIGGDVEKHVSAREKMLLLERLPARLPPHWSRSSKS